MPGMRLICGGAQEGDIEIDFCATIQNALGLMFGTRESKDDGVFLGSLALRSLRRGHLLYHPAQWHEPGYLRNRALDLVERRVGSVGHYSHGHPNLASRNPSRVQIATLVL